MRGQAPYRNLTEALAVYEDKRILVTGGAGYIATGLVAALSAVPCHITRLCRSGGGIPIVFPNAAAKVEDPIEIEKN